MFGASNLMNNVIEGGGTFRQVDYSYGLNLMSSAEHTIAESRANPSNFD